MKIRGKKLNSNQRKVLINNGVDNVDDYLYLKTEVIDSCGCSKHLNQKSRKIEYLVIVDRETGEERRLRK